MSTATKTLAEVKAAFERGEFKPDDFLMLDNDHTGVYRYNAEEEDIECLCECGMPGRLLEQALDLLGIQWQGA